MSLIISTNKKGLFGINGSLAFQSKADLNNFSKLTKAFGNVVMGSNTYKSLPENMKPLPDRLNIVLSKNTKFIQSIVDSNVVCVSSIKDVFEIVEDPCFIGGGQSSINYSSIMVPKLKNFI